MSEVYEIIKNDWIQISVIAFMAIMLICGYYKGLVKMSSNLVSFIISLAITRYLRPQIQEWLMNNQYIEKYIKTNIYKNISDNINSIPGEVVINNQIENKDTITKQLIKQTIESNQQNSIETFYDFIGLDKITDIVVDKMTGFIISVLTFILLLVVVTIIVKILFKLLERIADLPVLTVFNRISGSILGLVESVLYIWIFLIIIEILPKNDFVVSMMNQINREGTWINMLKQANIFIRIFDNIMN
ncbi:CvpA family protein [Oribacterium sp. WCC10]|uniref:CvpA family protein n=1 Tax=Oribacterium sp. WCC10 TaxID=1855343 RepID=UPI0008E59555|nr:CvpA family protein [Oribacterium sp. WCC10]SFG83213.1 Colicin V production protein [Oribacterium sp. WCC10]